MEIELRIRDILSSPSRLKDKVHSVLEEIKSNPDDSELHKSALKYLFNSGHYQEVLAVLAEMLDRQVQIPWDILIHTLKASGIPLTHKAVLQSIEKGVSRQNSTAQLWAVTELDEDIPEFKFARQAFQKTLKDQIAEKRSELLDKFEFLRNQRLIPEARQVLRQMKLAYPEDSTIRQLESQFEEERARSVVNERSTSPTTDALPRPARRSQEESQILNTLLTDILDLVKKAPENKSEAIKDLSLFFLFLEAPDLSLKILEGQESLNYSNQWLMAESQKRSGRFIEALSQATLIQNLNPNDSEITFAVTYFKAEVFGELGHFDKAIQLLESILKIRPNYRSTAYLLEKWKSRGSEF